MDLAGEGRRMTPGPILAIGAVVVLAAGAFAYTAGWLTPHRLTPDKLVNTLAPPGGPALGHRRNHSKGICFTGDFQSNGNGAALSRAELLAAGTYPVIGRLNFAGGDPHMPDAMAAARGFSMQITGPGGAQWRSAMLEAPVFLASTPQNFYEFLKAASSKDKDAVPQFLEAHPESKAFLGWAKTHPRTESWTEDRFNSLNSFAFTDKTGAKHTVRWSILPENAPVTLSPEELKAKSPDFLEDDIVQRVAKSSQHWKLVVTVANPGDPTADPTHAWPADRRTIDVGTIAINHIEEEADGPCREINFDPTVLPPGIATSDDPFPAARSAAYRVSYDRRTAEEKDYPHTAKGGQ